MKLFILTTFLLLYAAAYCQKKNFDIVTYTPPAGWTKQETEKAVIYLTENKNTGGFCLLSILISRSSAGKAETDFTNAWNEYIKKGYDANAKPASQEKAKADNGWEVISGASAIKLETADALALLTVMTGEKLTFSVVAVLNDTVYFSSIDKFLEDLDINADALAKIKSATTPSQANNMTTSTIAKTETEVLTFGNIKYQVPAGWLQYVSANKVEIFPSKPMPEEKLEIILLTGRTGSSLEAELENCWEEVRRMYNAENTMQVSGYKYNKKEIRKSAKGWEYLTADGSIRIGQNDFFVHPYIIKVRDRIERVVVMAQEVVIDAVRRNYDPFWHHPPYTYTINSFIFNLGFTNWTETEVTKPGLKGSGVVGIWQGLGFKGGELKATFIALFSNGQAYYSVRVPTMGFYQLDPYAAGEMNMRDWGIYTFQNGNGVIKMPYGSFPIRLEGDKLVAAPIKEEHKYVRVSEIDNLVLNGTWGLEDANGNIATIRFGSDGSFTDNGALQVLDHSIYYYSIAQGGGSGKYFIKDHTIVFNYNDGRELRVAFPGSQFTNEKSPQQLVLSFNEDVLIKQF
jgi:hypothetical protein